MFFKKMYSELFTRILRGLGLAMLGLILMKKNSNRACMHPIAVHYVTLRDDYPPKSSKWIIAFSPPRLSRRSSTVLAIMGGPQR